MEQMRQLLNANERMQAQIMDLQNRMGSPNTATAGTQEASSSGTQVTTQDLAAALAALPTRIAEAAGKPNKKKLIDVRGVVRQLRPFTNSENEFLVWQRKLESHVSSIFPEARELMTWAADRGRKVDLDEIDDEGELEATREEACDLQEQLHAVLVALTDGESFDIVTASGPGEGLEAWRRLCERWDPYTPGRARIVKGDLEPAAV